MLKKNYSISRSKKILGYLLFATLATTTSGCASLDPLAPTKAEARLVCDYLNEVFKNKEVGFALARKKSTNELTRLFCLYEKGLVLPGDKKFVAEYPKPVSVNIAQVVNKVDRTKLRGKEKPKSYHKIVIENAVINNAVIETKKSDSSTVEGKK